MYVLLCSVAGRDAPLGHLDVKNIVASISVTRKTSQHNTQRRQVHQQLLGICTLMLIAHTYRMQQHHSTPTLWYKPG